MSGRRLLVVGAHSADFVWRASGAIAKNTAAGGESVVVALSYGERGESGELWKEEGQTEENVKAVRHKEAEAAAAAVGAELVALDLGDYPLRAEPDAVDRLAGLMRDFAPDVVLTHPDKDPFNPDHPVAHTVAAQARLLTSGAGVESGFRTVPPTEFLVFEPHQPELCGFVPTVFVDITSVMDRKEEAMSAMAAQSYLREYYTERAGHRGNHARKVTGDKTIRQAEAFQRLVPNVVEAL
ncbi:PIG-L deacetylase family protein [Myceligenerans pegani]|uniref:PIG-L family deacetylase n=1 Tax=Myceligenerans pegani TaxID=2776917 RepID=A0ABR9N7C5_9MICO|nr:PIG-L deacetylase family protein [Myceligenerans sp. TRM 65318]MBE1879038.1 PIG-L family deacetylase [Myceligenerans sp. TRM 65318]MBE3021309.1 PIG-L family deacetylase [Myceligenerans sp. TRM 65318]